MQLLGNFFADFQRIFFQLNLRATCANRVQIVHDFSAFSAQFSRKLCANFAFFSDDFCRDCVISTKIFSCHAGWNTRVFGQ